MITGPACNGSSTPPMPAPPEIWQFLPICAHEPTVAQVSIMVPLSTYAPRLTKDGISTTPGAINAECRTTQPGTARKPALRKRAAFQPLNLESTLSHHAALPGPPGITLMSLRRKDSSTAFLSHWLTCHWPSVVRSATRALPASSSSRAAVTALRTAPLVFGPILSRASKASSMVLASLSLDMDVPARSAAVCRGRGRGCQAACIGLWSCREKKAMNRQLPRLALGLALSAFGSVPAFAHHVMGGRMPATFGEGILSGLGHPVIGLDHLAAVIAVGCLAAAHRSASALAVAFVLAMM